jgi:hypothetical protein
LNAWDAASSKPEIVGQKQIDTSLRGARELNCVGPADAPVRANSRVEFSGVPAKRQYLHGRKAQDGSVVGRQSDIPLRLRPCQHLSESEAARAKAVPALPHSSSNSRDDREERLMPFNEIDEKVCVPEDKAHG